MGHQSESVDRLVGGAGVGEVELKGWDRCWMGRMGVVGQEMGV